MSSDNLDIVKALVKLEKQTNELDKSICKYKDKEIKRLQQRIDKVIEYIEENMSYIANGKKDYIPAGEDLLDVLKGSEE